MEVAALGAAGRSRVKVEKFQGNAQFTSPEMVLGRLLDVRADVYSLGALAFTLISGQPLFPYDSPSKVLQAQVSEDPPTLTSVARSLVPPDLEFVVGRALSKLPEYRYKTMSRLRHALLSCEAAGRWTTLEAQGWWAGWGHTRASDEAATTALTHDATQPTRPEHPRRSLLQ
jgi:serine/threonine-protein kinase